ncbi:efflux RND transporter permease subunit [Marinomonas ostreistagni]|uniref:Efflux RND transporter permease subunit n=1 Tax=Marinomonas ostreistagni TaxID=359209 RepID=A0ABS0ZF23_9GAMM|nr:efflux RND transporter permease subunit [Marinomonas ostreistagni]MBJ7552217.1 efflux RND transporter permease subunit [Marinomonas ostreistagni]
MRTIIDASLTRSRTVLLIFVLIILSGVVSYIEIPKESTPDITIPMAYVSVSLEGIAPEDSDSLLVHPLEQELRGVEGLKEIRSTASEGHASLILEFESGTNIDQAIINTKDKVDRAKSELPSDADEPTVTEINLSTFPVLRINLYGDIDFPQLSRIANNLQDDIEAVKGVLEANIQGDREQQAEIIIDQQKLDSYGLSLTDVLNLLSSNNRLVAAGNLDTGAGRFPIKVPGLLQTKEDILNLPLKVSGTNIVQMKDIATGELTFKDATSYARANGKSSITLAVSKRVGANIIETIDAVKDVINNNQATWPEELHYSLTQDESGQIETSLNDLFNNVLAATLLVMVVIVWALGIRSAILVGLAIPGAFLTGILFLNLQGYTINMVVLFALILSVGMLVDGAIVVTEYADRKLAEGQTKQQAYASAARRMAWPIIASTATTLAVFMPLLFWPDIVGEFMRYMPITVIATLSASLLMALIFLPTMGAIFGKRGAYSDTTLASLKLTEEGNLNDLQGLTGRYGRLLTKLVEHPIKVLFIAIAALIGVITLYSQFGKGIEFFPNIEPEVANIEVRARGDLSLIEKDQVVQQVELLALNEPDFKSVTTTTYSSAPDNGSPDAVGIITLEFTDWFSRRPASEILQDFRDKAKSIPGILVSTVVEQGGPQSGSDIELQLSSNYSAVINESADRIIEELRTRPEIVSVNDDRSLPGLEWRLEIDRAEASKFGVNVDMLGNVVKLVTTGITLGDFLPDGAEDKIDIVVRFPTSQRNLEQLDQLHIPTNSGIVPISNFVRTIAAPKQGYIHRVDGKRAVKISADVKDGLVVDQVIKQIQQKLSNSDLPTSLDYEFRGNTEDQQKAGAFLMKAFAVAFFIMTIILVTQFNNFFQCLLILSAVIFSTIGVFVGLMLKGEPFGIVMSGVGVIALAGVVVNNNIVLIDTFNGLKQQGMDVKEAAIRTGVQRLRPVMLTTITTILGLLPMVFQLNIDFIHRELSIGAPSSQWWTQLSTAIAGGLAFATPLTLILTPCLLVLGQKKKRKEI